MGQVGFNSNILSLTAQRRLNEASSHLQRASERLSSGLRINRASDDAAGLAISSRLGADSRIYTQAIRNGNDALSLLNVAEGTTSELTTILTRMRELAVQAANGTFSNSQRNSLDREAHQLQLEYNRLTQATRFNGLAPLAGGFGRLNIQLGYGNSSTLGIQVGSGLEHGVGTGRYGDATASDGLYGVNEPVLVDIDNDGDLDLVSSTGNQISVKKQGADGQLGDPIFTNVSTTDSILHIRVGDFNEDGKLDVVTGSHDISFDPQLAVIFGNGDGTFKNALTLNNLPTSILGIGDYNSDGNLDIQQFDDFATERVMYGNGNGTFRSAVAVGRGLIHEAFDANADGINDLLTTNGGQFRLYRGRGNNQYETAYTSFGTGTSIQVGDLDSDGDMDIVTSLLSNTLAVHLSNGNGTFGAAQTVDSVQGYIKAYDINQDGYLDIASSNGTSMRTLFGNGDGTFKSAVVESLTTSYLAIGDLNGDGAPDIAGDTNLFFAEADQATYLARIHLTTRQYALDSINVIDAAMARVSEELSVIGAGQSRLSSALNSLFGRRDGSEAARSRIIDADIAAESAEYVRRDIQQQTAASVLAQANLIPDLALRLLRV